MIVVQCNIERQQRCNGDAARHQRRGRARTNAGGVQEQSPIRPLFQYAGEYPERYAIHPIVTSECMHMQRRRWVTRQRVRECGTMRDRSATFLRQRVPPPRYAFSPLLLVLLVAYHVDWRDAGGRNHSKCPWRGAPWARPLQTRVWSAWAKRVGIEQGMQYHHHHTITYLHEGESYDASAVDAATGSTQQPYIERDERLNCDQSVIQSICPPTNSTTSHMYMSSVY
jgi:hypothetical protein